MSSEASSGRPSEAASGLDMFDDLADLFLGIDVNAPLTAPAGGLPAEVGRVAPL